MLVENILVEEDVEINGVILEKGSYHSKDFCFRGSALNACATRNYKIDKDGNVSLVIFDKNIIKYFSKKEKERLLLKPNGIVHIYSANFYNSDLNYKLVLEKGVIKKLYRADNDEDFEKFPKKIQMNYDAEWK